MTKIVELQWVVLVLLLGLVPESCITDEYDLSGGVNTDILIGGDSLIIPLGTSKKVFLSSLISSSDSAVLKITKEGNYALERKDSVSVDIKGLDPISLSIEPIVIDPIDFKFVDFKLPSFHLSTFSIETPFTIPEVTVTETIDPINFQKNYIYPIEMPSAAPTLIKSTTRGAVSYLIDPIVIAESGSVAQDLDLGTYPLQLNKVNRVYLSNNYINIRFNRSKVKSLNLATRNEIINIFRVDFPPEYHLSGNEGIGSRIEGSSLVIENTTLPSDVDEVVYRVKVDYLDMSGVLQNNSIVYNRNIDYHFNYTLSGSIENPLSLVGKSAEMDVLIDTAPVISDMEVVTNPISIPVADGQVNQSNVITGVPSEVSYISSLTFEEGAVLNLDIPDPGIAPFSLVSGNCIIQLPKSIHFKARAGLDSQTNVLTLPCSQLFGLHQLEVVSVDIDQAIPVGGGSFTINENVSYQIVGCTTSATTVLNSRIRAFSADKFVINCSSNTIQLKDANVMTREINTVVPTQNTPVKINKMVSTDVRKIYSFTLENPVAAALRLSITGLPSNIDSVFFRNYTIKLPICMQFAAGNTNAKNEVILNRGFKVSEGFTKLLQLQSFNFGTTGIELNNGVLNLNENVTLSGSMYVKGTNLKASDFGDIHIAPSVTVDQMSLALADVWVSNTILPVKENIPLSLPTFLNGKDVNLDIQNPVICVVASNSTGIPVEVPIQLIPKKNGQVLQEGVVNTTLLIAASEVIGKPSYSRFWLAKNSEGVSEGYVPVIIPGLPDLVKTLPDNIEVKMDPVINGDHHRIDLLSQNNKIKVNYDIRIPFDFGKEFLLNYQDSVVGIQKNLVDIVNKISTCDLIAEIDNQIPMVFDFDIKPLDPNLNLITGLSISKPDSVKAGNVDGSPQRSRIFIKIKEISEGALAKLDGFEIKLSAKRNSTIAGIPLRPDQYFTLKLGIGLPNGIALKGN